MAIAKDLLDGNSGVVGTNDLKVTPSDPVAMSVTVPAGVVYHYISSVASYYRHKLADAATVLTIDANSSGSTRYDLVCVKTDLTVTPDADGYGTATTVIVKGTPGSGVPSTPANHYKIAEVEVDNGAVSIADAKITDRRNVIALNTGILIKPILTSSATPGIGATQTLDLNTAKIFTITMPAGDLTLAISNSTAGKVFIVEIINATSQGALTWFSTVKWANGTTPTLTGTNGKKDTFGFRCTSAGNYEGYIIGQNI